MAGLIRETLPPLACAFVGVRVGPYVYDAVVGPSILKHVGLGGLHEYGAYAEGATNIAVALALLFLYRQVVALGKVN